MGQEPHDQRFAVADSLDAVFGLVGDLGDGVAAAVGQLATFEVAHRYSAGLSSGA
jgi:hypothetical protein